MKALILGAGVAAVGALFYFLAPIHDGMSYTERKSVMDAVRGRLKDPDSARFDGMVVTRSAVSVTVCGYVNARNGFGAYAGRRRFYVSVIGQGPGVAIMDNPSVVDGMCRKAELPDA